MMRSIVTILILLNSVFCFSQNYELVKKDQEEYFELHIELPMDLTIQYPDGRWKIFDSIDTSILRYQFHLTNNKVHGPFLEFYKDKVTYGNYYMDSLWTFLINPNDTTFKTGRWRTSVGDISLPDELYPLQYGVDSIAKEIWRYSNGRIAREAIYKKGFGMMKLSYYDGFNGKIKSEQLISEQQDITTYYSNDSITSISVSKGNIRTYIDYSYPFCDSLPCISFQIENEIGDRIIIVVDKDLNLNQFIDSKSNITLIQDQNGKIEMIHGRKYKKLKSRKLRIK